MRVKTIRLHLNAHKPQPVKNIGRKYDVSDAEGERLIGMGVVVADAED